MSEITKLYENANIEKEVIKGCYDYYSKLGIDIWKENDCAGKNCDTCKKDKSIKRYPPFTAEKQMLLLDFLSKYEVTIINESNTPYYMIYTHNKVGSVKANNIGELMAKYINMFIWQDLTEEEKQQVKGILE